MSLFHVFDGKSKDDQGEEAEEDSRSREDVAGKHYLPGKMQLKTQQRVARIRTHDQRYDRGDLKIMVSIIIK